MEFIGLKEMLRISLATLFVLSFMGTALPQSPDKVYYQPRATNNEVIELSGDGFSGRWTGNSGADHCRPCSINATPLVLSLDGGMRVRGTGGRDRIALSRSIGPLTIGKQEFTRARGNVKIFFSTPDYLPTLNFGRRIKYARKGPATVVVDIHEEDRPEKMIYKKEFDATCTAFVRTHVLNNLLPGPSFSTQTVEYFCDLIPEQ